MDALVDTLLSRLAHASVQAALLVGVVFVVCRYVPALSAAAKTTLWWLVSAQGIAGIVCPTLFGLPWLPAVAPTGGTTFVVAVPSVVVAGGTPTIDEGGAFSWGAALVVVWGLAIVAQAVVAAMRWRRIAGISRRAIPHDDVRIETLCARRARDMGLRKSPRLVVSADVDSPQVIGFHRTTILLPLEEQLDDNELDLALMHELAHVRRGDLVLGWVPALARTLFFFHPLVHLAVREYALCREAACDARVVSRGGPVAKQYGRLLLRLGVAPHPHHALPGASPTFHVLKRRLLMLGQANETHPRVLTWCLVAVIATVGVVPWRVVAARPESTGSTVATTATLPPPPPPAPALPAAPAAPAAPPIPPTLPAAPPAPPAAMSAADGKHVSTYFSSDVQVTKGGHRESRQIDIRRNGDDDVMWYRDGQQTWALRDPAYLKRIHEALARAEVPADMGKMSADKQAALDRRQAVLNDEMAKLSARQARLAMKESDPTGPRDSGAYAAGHVAISKEQAAIAQQMAELGQQRALQGQTMAEWSHKQAEAARQSSAEVNAIIAEAVRNHAVQPAR